MRGTLIPQRSAAHKLACLSLYRGLLRQCLRFQDQPTSTTLIKLIRYRFHLDKNIVSPWIICDALQKGRQVYSLIRDAASGSAAACAQLSKTLEQSAAYASDLAALRSHQTKLRSPTRPAKVPKINHLRDASTKEWAERIPNPIPIRDRPVPKEALPNPDRPRKVPILSHAMSYPFLRYKAGPTSPRLSRVLNGLIKTEVKRWNTVHRLQDEIDHACLEDEWDRLVRTNTGYQDSPDDQDDNGRGVTKSWADDALLGLQEVQAYIRTAQNKQKMTAREMWNIVQRERALAEKEKAERKAQRLAEWERTQAAVQPTNADLDSESDEDTEFMRPMTWSEDDLAQPEAFEDSEKE